MENSANTSTLVDSGSNEMSDFERRDLKQVIDIICFTIRSITLNGEPNCRTLNIEECISSLRLLKDNVYDIQRIETLLTEYPLIIHELVDAITMVLKAAIRNELVACSYVSIILNEHSCVEGTSQISVILRYVKGFEICERFIAFVNTVGFEVTPLELNQIITTYKKAYLLENKVLALASDGAVLHSQKLLGFRNSKLFGCRYFLPCYFHELGRIIFQSLNYMEDCHLFFKTVSMIESFFENKQNYQKLENILLIANPKFKKRKWDFTNPFLVLISTYRKKFIEYFDIEIHFLKNVPTFDRMKMIAFLNFLTNLKTIFLLKVFTSIFFNHLDKLMNFVNVFETYYARELSKFQSNIERLKTLGFEKLWMEANIEKFGKKKLKKMKTKLGYESTKKEYSILFQKILEEIQHVLRIQTIDVQRIEFCHLLNVNTFGVQVLKETFIPQLLKELPRFFVRSILRDEVNVLQNIEMFKNKNVYDIMAIFKEKDYTSAFVQLFKLGEFILAMPCLPPTKGNYERTKLKEIAPFSYVPSVSGNPSGEISILGVEKNLLQKLQRLKGFHDAVINTYLEKKKRIVRYKYNYSRKKEISTPK